MINRVRQYLVSQRQRRQQIQNVTSTFESREWQRFRVEQQRLDNELREKERQWRRQFRRNEAFRYRRGLSPEMLAMRMSRRWWAIAHIAFWLFVELPAVIWLPWLPTAQGIPASQRLTATALSWALGLCWILFNRLQPAFMDSMVAWEDAKVPQRSIVIGYVSAFFCVVIMDWLLMLSASEFLTPYYPRLLMQIFLVSACTYGCVAVTVKPSLLEQEPNDLAYNACILALVVLIGWVVFPLVVSVGLTLLACIVFALMARFPWMPRLRVRRPSAKIEED